MSSNGRYIPVSELASRLSCSDETIRRQCRDGRIPAIKVGRDWRVDADKAILSLSKESEKK